jgi:CubicO group peptidase (beta-lactamase class C family)
MRPLLALLAPLLLALPTAAQTPTKVDFSVVDARMQSLVARYGLDGASLWVSHNGQPVLTRHYGGYSDTTRIPIASASKWVSALVLARLVERGTLRWDSTVGEWWPTAPADKRAITLAQMFSHTSGLPGDEAGCIANPITTLQACAAQILAGPMIAAPGSTFAYGGLSMQVAGAMAERATGAGWEVLFAREVTTPLALTATDFGLNSTAPGIVTVPNPRIAGGIRSTLADYRKLMAMWQADGLIREGPNAGQRYLAVATIRAMQRDHALGTVKQDVPPVSQGIDGWGYGFGYWRLPTTRAGAPVVETSPGAFGFQGWVDGSAGIAGVFMVQDTNVRMASEAAAVQADLARLLDPPRFTQSAGRTPSAGRAQGRLEFVEGAQRLRRVDHRRPGAHVDRE